MHQLLVERTTAPRAVASVALNAGLSSPGACHPIFAAFHVTAFLFRGAEAVRAQNSACADEVFLLTSQASFLPVGSTTYGFLLEISFPDEGYLIKSFP